MTAGAVHVSYLSCFGESACSIAWMLSGARLRSTERQICIVSAPFAFQTVTGPPSAPGRRTRRMSAPVLPIVVPDSPDPAARGPQPTLRCQRFGHSVLASWGAPAALGEV